MPSFPIPAALHGDALTDELAAAGFTATVYVSGDELVINGPADTDHDAVQAVIDAHVPPAPPPDPETEFRAAVKAATSIADLKAALLGNQVVVRPTR